jgi:hypothetical protein
MNKKILIKNLWKYTKLFFFDIWITGCLLILFFVNTNISRYVLVGLLSSIITSILIFTFQMTLLESDKDFIE